MCPCQAIDGKSWPLGCHPTSGIGSGCSVFTRNEEKWHKKFLTLSVGNATQEAEGDQCMGLINTLADHSAKKVLIYAKAAFDLMTMHSQTAFHCRIGNLPPSERPFSSATVIWNKASVKAKSNF